MSSQKTVWDLPVYHPIWICLMIVTVGPVVTLFTWANCNRFDLDEVVQILQITGGMIVGVVTFVVKWDKAHGNAKSATVDD